MTTGNTVTDKAQTTIDLKGITRFKSGKVREVFDLGSSLLLVASDRISAFDCILPTGIPHKGHVLNQLSTWWFKRLAGVVPNHVLETEFSKYPAQLQPFAEPLRGRSMIVKKTEVIPVECVARGYLIGSGWKEYKESGVVSGIKLRPGYRMADKLDEPIFTPAHKAESGHDENITFAQVVERIGAEHAAFLRDTTLKLYTQAADYARQRGIIIADTKFEFGILDGDIILIDEVLTPDSSRFWPASSYAPGQSPPSFDKQFVRDYLETLAWNKQPPAPTLPPDVVARTREKYIEAFKLLSGQDLAV
ncbi:MAG: phosphoribosylaminoimidazolesuccinocarboxamide synthase [bacterium]